MFGDEVYLGLYDTAAALLIAIDNGHPLSDGNKHLAWIVAKGLLALNGYHLAAGSSTDGEAFRRSVADHQVERWAIVGWIETHSTRL